MLGKRTIRLSIGESTSAFGLIRACVDDDGQMARPEMTKACMRDQLNNIHSNTRRLVEDQCFGILLVRVFFLGLATFFGCTGPLPLPSGGFT
jgi:hypothetical protein